MYQSIPSLTISPGRGRPLSCPPGGLKIKKSSIILKKAPKGPTTCKNFRNETLFIADYENVLKFVFDWLAAKRLKESTILLNDYSFE